MDRPDSIEKRLFSCKCCDYSVHVYGESYFDSGCHNYMSTFRCPVCKALFESLISQINMDENSFEASHGLADEIDCLRCGNKMAKVWNRASGRCPKCEGEMSYDVVGTIKVKFQ